MIHKMAADRLRDALNKRERGLLQRALADCEQNYSEEYKGDMRRAEDTLRILSARERELRSLFLVKFPSYGEHYRYPLALNISVVYSRVINLL